MVLIFFEVADGYDLGLLDRDRAIRMTGAVAQDVEASYGGVDRWFVAEALRGKPEDFRCAHCERVGCNGRECQDWDDPQEDY
jgi:hypothetical protein